MQKQWESLVLWQESTTMPAALPACSPACHPLWIECRGVETAHWARMFAIHSRPNAAAICPQVAATAVICTSSLLQPTDPLEPVETLPLTPTPPPSTPFLCFNSSAAQQLEDYPLSLYLCLLTSYAPAKKRGKKAILVHIWLRKSKDIICTQRNVFLSNAMPLPEYAWEAFTRLTLFHWNRPALWAGTVAGRLDVWEQNSESWRTKPEHCVLNADERNVNIMWRRRAVN